MTGANKRASPELSTFRPLPPKRPAQPPPSPRRCGTVRMWVDDKGFGFIEPDNPGPDVFLHNGVQNSPYKTAYNWRGAAMAGSW